MSKIIVGVFHDRSSAESAIAAVEQAAGSALGAVVHEEYLRDDDVPMSGTVALKGAVLGAVVVGGFGAVIGGVLANSILGFGVTEFLLVAIAGSVMGVTAGAVAGASEPTPEIRRMAARLTSGAVIVTVPAKDEVPTATIRELFVANGALELNAA